jgi:hypothetical protein
MVFQYLSFNVATIEVLVIYADEDYQFYLESLDAYCRFEK